MSTFKNNYGCGLFNTVFRPRPKPSASAASLPTTNVPDVPRTPKRPDRIVATTSPNQQTKATPPLYVQQVARKGTPDEKIGSRGSEIERNDDRHGYYQRYGRNNKVPQGSTGISGELEAMIDEHQSSKNAGNMIIYGNLGNLRQGNLNDISYHPKTKRNQEQSSKKSSKKDQKSGKNPTSLCRALSTRMDPEQLKIMGNEDYKNGRFAEALSLYEAAIAIDPKKASYRSNKSAALTGLGRLLEAVFEAKEAISIEPFYQRAHNRLATLYLRLGDADKTIHHYKQSGSEAEPDLITRARNLQVHLNRCIEAKMHRDWNTLLKETNLAISAGADSALKALLKLHRHEEADEALRNAPKFEVNDCTKFYGPISHAYFLLGKWQAAIDDYKLLAKEAPEDEE
ncbi:Tetratricopeptide-like helical, partial [Cynara cardunculus var. scolymus]